MRKLGDCLDEAKKIITQDRNDQHGEPEDCFGLISKFWSAYTGIVISPHDVAILMSLLKIARMARGKFNLDNYLDACGYTSIAADKLSMNGE